MMGGSLITGAIAANYAADLTNGMSQKVNISEKSIETSTNIASNINSDSNINISADQGNLISISSNIKTEDGDITLQSNNGDVMLGSTTDTKKEYSREYSKGFSQTYAKFDRQAEAGVQFNEEETIKTTTTNTASVNNLEANNGNLTINSKGSIISVGSQIYADNNINLKATDGNILLTSANNSETTETQHDKTTISTGVKVGNAYVDAGYAISDVNKAQNEVEKARKELTKMKNLQAEGKASKQAVEDAEDNLKMAQANLAYASLQALAAMASAAQVASDSLATGFYVNAFVNYDTETTKINEQSTWQTQGNLMSKNGNINFTSGNNMTQEGTNTYALNGDINYDITNNLDIIASKDTYSYTEKASTKHAGISVGTKVDSNMALNGITSALDLGGGNVSNKVRSTTYNNVDIIANNIKIKTGNNTDIKGANITATDSIDMDIGNNLNIESLQDTYYATSKNNSWSASASFNAKGRGDGPKYSGGIGGGGTSINSTTDSQWVNEQTSIIADNNINIRTNNNTNLIGSVVASNTNNLTLNTNSLTYQDLNDYYTSTTKGSGLTTNVGTSSESFFKGIAPNGTTTITLVNSGEDKKQNTRATIGNGNIIITDNSDISDLNRNVANSQNITQDQITGALNGTMQIDNRIFGAIKYGDKKTYETDENGNPVLDENGNQKVNTQKEFGVGDGWKSIYSDVRNVGGNTKDAIIGASKDADRIIEGTYKISEKVGEAVAGDTGKDILGGLARLTLGSTIGGVASAFGETNSKIIVADKDANGNILKDEKGNTITKTITREELASGDYKNYEVLGIMSGEKGAIAEINLKPNTAERTNPTDGFFGDLIESGLGKVFNALDASDMMAMSREVAADLKAISSNENTSILNANFHSQGTIIEQGALHIYKKPYLDANGKLTSYQEQVKLNSNIKYNSLGYAVYEDENRELYRDLGVNSNKNDPNKKVEFDRDDKDSVQQLTSPKGIGDFWNGLKNLVNIDSHSINNSRYDKYYDSVDLIERSKIDMDRYGGKENTDYNLVSPDNINNNNKANYVIPSYIRANDK